MKILLMMAASALSASLVVPTVSQGQTREAAVDQAVAMVQSAVPARAV